LKVIEGKFNVKADANTMVDAVMKTIYSFEGCTNIATVIGVLELCKKKVINDANVD